jgi:hypothetical protein
VVIEPPRVPEPGVHNGDTLEDVRDLVERAPGDQVRRGRIEGLKQEYGWIAARKVQAWDWHAGLRSEIPIEPGLALAKAEPIGELTSRSGVSRELRDDGRRPASRRGVGRLKAIDAAREAPGTARGFGS